MKEPYYKGYVASYEAYLERSPYAREVASRLLSLVEGAHSMLDIGAGTGIFSLIVPASVHATAVEPSEAMCAQIAKHSRVARRDVRIIYGDWETAEVEAGAYDVVLCANAVYQMRPLDDMLYKMVRACRATVLIVMNGRDGVGIYGKMRRALQAAGIACSPAPRGHTLHDVRRALSSLDLTYAEEMASWQEVTRFACLQEAIDRLCARYGVAERDKARAEDVLAPYLEEDGGAYTITDDIEMAFITIRVQ